jgi:hypothetical protein
MQLLEVSIEIYARVTFLCSSLILRKPHSYIEIYANQIIGDPMEPVFQTNVISVGQRTYMIGSQFLTQRYKNRTLFVFLCDEINTIFFVGSRVIL